MTHDMPTAHHLTDRYILEIGFRQVQKVPDYDYCVFFSQLQ
jgi:hypothetical protein